MASKRVDPLIKKALDEAVEVGGLLVVVLDPEARILHFNAACERLTGFSAEEVVGTPVWRLIPEDEREAVQAVHAEMQRTGAPSHHENYWLTKRGERRRIAWSNATLRDGEGMVARGIGTGLDVTALRASQIQRLEAEQRLAAIVESAMDAIVTVDGEQRIVVFNEAAEKMFGRPREEVLGRPHSMLIPERFRAIHEEQVRRFARSGESRRRIGELGRVSGLRASGEEFPAEASISRAESGGQMLLTAIFRDLSERERLERQLRQSQETAALGALIAGLAHDIGTPLNVILGYIGMLTRSVSKQKDQERLRIVREQVERVSGLVETLLNYARPSEAKPAPIRVEDVLERALDLIPELARRRHVRLERQFGDTPPIRVQGDRLERAFLNLLVNACDAMDECGGVLRVSTGPLPGGGVHVCVADEGKGIPEALRERIFEPFVTTKERGRGSGLGLFVTRGIVREQGGSIAIRDGRERGTEICVELPAEAPAA